MLLESAIPLSIDVAARIEHLHRSADGRDSKEDER
jgi:hypothetical protein